MSAYVVVSVFDPANGSRAAVLTWGPYPTREKATAVKRWMQREDARASSRRAGTLTFHVVKIPGDGPAS